MKVTFLGTNGWYDTFTGNTVSILIEAEGYNIILDAGNGIQRLNDYVRDENQTYLFLSHFHLDHIVGLHLLSKFKFAHGLKVVGQMGTREILKAIINEPYTVSFSKLPFPVEIIEIDEGNHNLPFPVLCHNMFHSSPTLGFRFILDGKVITYCPDTGYCENAVKLAENADLLIAECALKTGEDLPDWLHLNPETAAKLAKEAKVKKLALVHFDADRYKTFSDRRQAKRDAQRIFPQVIAAKDGMEIKL